MNCPKCEPDAKSKRWLWWAGILVVLLVAGWLERSSPGRAASNTSEGAPSSPRDAR